MGLRPLEIVYTYSAGIDIFTSETDVYRSIPALNGLKTKGPPEQPMKCGP